MLSSSVFALGALLLQNAVLGAEPGLQTATFDTLHGTVVVSLPEDARAGDTISGTVVLEPRGKDAAERAKNAAALGGFGLEAAGVRTGAGKFKLLVPAALIASMPFTLKDARGRTVGRAQVPLDAGPPAVHEVFQAPPLAQNGRPIACIGQFDGDYATTKVQIMGSPLDVLAESPRTMTAKAPADAVGPCELKVKEGEREFSAAVQGLSVRLSAPTTTLTAGQSTQVQCVVSGFEGAPDGLFPVPFELQCLTPATAQLEGIPGGFVAHAIRKEDVSSGAYRYTVGLVGTRAGTFSVSARVIWAWPWSKKKKENPLLTKPATPETSPFFKCCWLITVGPGKGVADVDHSAVSIDGKVYSFEGGGMVVYPNTGAYLNKRKFEDGRQVWVNPVPGVDKDAMRKKAQEIIDAKKPYDLFGNNCALNAAGLLEAGGKKNLLKEVKPLRLQNRNENLGEIGKSEEITKKQVE